MQTGIIPFAVACVLAAATALECHSFAAARTSVASWIFSFLYGAMLGFWWVAVIEILWRASRRWPAMLQVSTRNIGLQLAIAAANGLLHLTILHFSLQWISRFNADAAVDYGGIDFFHLGRFGVEILVYALVWFACTALHSQLAAQRNAVRSLELERQLSSAHLRALQMQLEPHFLFNTLNALTALMELGRTPEALETLGNLNTILKAVLQRNTPGKIPLAHELEIVESYLAIERVRFADRLRVAIDLDPNALDGLVPCFLLQPIIENAIRHGIAHCENDGRIEVSARRVGDRMHLLVRDNGPGLNGNSRPGFGVGLTNTRERLAHFYEDDHEIRAFEPRTGGFEVSITIPYERATEFTEALSILATEAAVP